MVMKAKKLNKGDSYGLLQVMKSIRAGGRLLWKCKCACGNVIFRSSNNLTSGAVKSCGCKKRAHLIRMNTTHGKSDMPEYKVWENMKTRCSNEKCPYYKHYGGRGISVCKRWVNSFELFLEDMGTKPTPKHELDRINNNGNYEASNCRWATRKQQRRNTRLTQWLIVRGETKPLCEWAEIVNVDANTIKSRLNVGYSIEDAVFGEKYKFTSEKGKGRIPSAETRIKLGEASKRSWLNRPRRTLTHNGVTRTYAEWEKATGINVTLLRSRIRAGWSIADALSTKAQKYTRNSKQ